MNKILRVVVGLVFLSSGLLKAMDAAAFADLMGKYGAAWFGYGAPVFIMEVLLGVLLIFNIRPREFSLITSGFIVILSVIYLYGISARGITNCGCFGPLTWLNSTPWITFCRNGVLLVLLIPSCIKQQENTRLTIPVVICMAIVSVIVMFMCGFSFRGAKCLQEERPFQSIAVSDSYLSSLVTIDTDSTYFIFAFSFDCPFCMNAIGNVNQYTQMHAVDRVIGLALDEPEKEGRFYRLFEPNFEIHTISPFAMYHIAHTLPGGFLIRNDSIVRQYNGIIISPALFLN